MGLWLLPWVLIPDTHMGIELSASSCCPSSVRSLSNCRATPPGRAERQVTGMLAPAQAHRTHQAHAACPQLQPGPRRAHAQHQHWPGGLYPSSAGATHHLELWQPEELVNETRRLPKPWLGLLSRPELLLPGAVLLAW